MCLRYLIFEAVDKAICPIHLNNFRICHLWWLIEDKHCKIWWLRVRDWVRVEGLERWLHGQEHVMPSERTQIRFPAFEEFFCCCFSFTTCSLLSPLQDSFKVKTVFQNRAARVERVGSYWGSVFELKHNFSYFLSAYLSSYFCLLQTGSRYVV